VAGLVSRAKIFSNREGTLSQSSIHIHYTVPEKSILVNMRNGPSILLYPQNQQ